MMSCTLMCVLYVLDTCSTSTPPVRDHTAASVHDPVTETIYPPLGFPEIRRTFLSEAETAIWSPGVAKNAEANKINK